MHLPVVAQKEVRHIYVHMHVPANLITNFDPRITVTTRNGEAHGKRSVWQRCIVVIELLLRHTTHFVKVKLDRNIFQFSFLVLDQTLTELPVTRVYK